MIYARLSAWERGGGVTLDWGPGTAFSRRGGFVLFVELKSHYRIIFYSQNTKGELLSFDFQSARSYRLALIYNVRDGNEVDSPGLRVLGAGDNDEAQQRLG